LFLSKYALLMSDNVDASLKTIFVHKLFICFTVINQIETSFEP
jgi:hypothetical protein